MLWKTLIALVLLTSIMHSATWWNASCNTSLAVYINTSFTDSAGVYFNLNETQDYFPARIILNTTNTTLYNQTLPVNVRFTNWNNDTVYPYEFDNGSNTSSGRSIYYVQTIGLTNVSNHQNNTIFAYICPQNVSTGENNLSTWRNASYVGVFHMNSDPGNDSTEYNDMNSVGAGITISSTNTPYGRSLIIPAFSYVGASSFTGMPTGNTSFTVSCLMSMEDTSSRNWANIGTIAPYYYSVNNKFFAFTPDLYSNQSTTSTGWLYIWFQSNRSHARINFNGTGLNDNDGWATRATTLSYSADGQYRFNHNAGVYSKQNSFDECKIRNTSSSNDWLKLEYGQFSTTGVYMTNFSGAPPEPAPNATCTDVWITPYPIANVSTTATANATPSNETFSFIFYNPDGTVLQNSSNSSYYIPSTYGYTRLYVYASNGTELCSNYTLVANATQVSIGNNLVAANIIDWFDGIKGVAMGILTVGIAFGLTSKIGHTSLMTAVMWVGIFVLFGGEMFIYGSVVFLVAGAVLTYANV